jgi:aldose 1-epimerase
MDLLTLESKNFKVVIAPNVGASVANCFVKPSEAWKPLMRETSLDAIEKANPSNYSSFTLAPFSNRLRNARFVFEAKDYQLRANADGHTQHGDVRSRPWDVMASNKNMLEARLDTANFPDFNFPSPFVMIVLYLLEDDTFTTHFRLTNTGSRAMPAGFGIHPYFNRFVTQELAIHESATQEEVKLQFSAQDYYVTENLIPTGERKTVMGELDFSKARAVSKQDINHVFRNWKNLKLHYPDFVLEFDCDPIFEHLVIYTSPDGSLAVEPVTNAADGFNLMAKGLDGTGVKVLQAGEVLEGSIRLKIKG